MDILPTILELANVSHPGETYKGRQVVKPRGKSWVNYLINKTDQVHDENTVTGWELFGQQAIRKVHLKPFTFQNHLDRKNGNYLI